MNLVLNARDAMPQGGRIVISTSHSEVQEGEIQNLKDLNPGSYVVLHISDTGCGMDAHTLEHLFEPYYTTKERDKGTGLGLATVYGIVMQGGGRIKVESVTGKGTAFTIYLPHVQETSATPSYVPLQEPTTVHGGQETILVVEDEDIVRQVATRTLRKNGYTVLEARDAKEALDISLQHKAPIHLLFTDVVMPGMNGRQLADAMVQQRPELKVLYMSGYTEDIIIHRGIVDPGITFIEKSFTPPILLKRVRDMIDSTNSKTAHYKVTA